MDRLGGDEEFLREVVSLYFDETPKVVDELRRAVADRQPPAVVAAAHRLKGSLLTLEAGPSARLAARLEQMGRMAELEGSPEVLSDLERSLARLSDELSSACA